MNICAFGEKEGETQAQTQGEMGAAGQTQGRERGKKGKPKREENAQRGPG